MAENSKIDDGGAAFPQNEFSAYAPDRAGLTKRDYFAAAALTGIVGPNYEWFTSNSEETGSRVHSAAHFAYSLADAMIAASNTGGA